MRMKKVVVLLTCVLAALNGCGILEKRGSSGAETFPEPSGQVTENFEEQGEIAGQGPSGEQGETGGRDSSGEQGEAAGQELPGEQEGDALEQEIREYLDSMTLEEKAAQLFVVLPESLVPGAGTVTSADSAMKAAFWEIPVGGFIYMEKNIKSREQITEMLANVQAYSRERIGLPAFLCVDEEGGTVARINGKGILDTPIIENMCQVGREGGRDRAYEIGAQLGSYLSLLGFNVDFAPVADVFSNPENKVVEKRSFGSDPRLVSELSLAVFEGLNQQGVLSCYKHFPGHGATAGDTHAGYSYTDKTLEELKACELIPFQEGIDRQVPIIMVGHISLPQVIGDDTPSSLSHLVITELLREEMGYDGLVVTDALNMGAIVQQYSSDQAAVMTLKAGADVILMPKDFLKAYEGVLKAVEDDRLSEERIDRSVERILRVKLGILKN